MRVLNYMMICLALVAGLSRSVSAQSAPLDEKQKAVVLFDIRLDRLQESDLAKAMGLKEQMAQSSATSEIDLSKAVRIFGMMSAPESIEELQQMQAGGGSMPMEFAMRVQFEDEAALDAVMNKMKAEGTEFSKDGKTFYRPDDETAPDNVCAGPVDSKTMVMGTDTYVTLPDFKTAFSKGVQSAWNNVSKTEDTIRIVVDLAGSKALVDQLLEMGQDAPPPAKAFLDLVPGMNDLRITMDFSGGNLFTLGSTCKDSESATNLNDALDSIFGMAKLTGEAQLGSLKDMGMDQVAGVAGDILKALKPKLDGNSVTVVVPKPDGFEDAVQQAAGMMGGMMGGPGGPPPGFEMPEEGDGDGGN